MDIKSKFLEFFKNENNKKIAYIFSFVFVLIISLSIYSINKTSFLDFKVSGANFDLWLKKVPYNTKTIDISFNFDIDETSIKDSIKITPEIPWIIKLKTPNTISYELSQNLNIWYDYTLVLNKNIKSKNSKTLEEDLVYIIKAVPALSVLKSLPSEKLDDLWANLSIFFSLPVVNFSNLSLKDKLPCPIEITPKVSWKCKWTTTSVLEFIPDSHFLWSTKYDVRVINVTWMNFSLEKEYNFSFETPKLTLNIVDSFLPDNWIDLIFNYPVSLDEVKKNISIENYKDLIITQVKDSENIFNIKLLNSDFKYEKSYKILVNWKINPKYWNITSVEKKEFNVYSLWLVSNIQPYQSVFSSTWELINTKNIDFWTYDYQYDFLPNKNIFFKIYLNNEIALNKSLFLFQTLSWLKVDFDIKYSKIEDENWNIVNDKKTIDLTLKDILKNNETYNLIISKQANKNLEKDIISEYKTSTELKVLRTKFVDYSKSCVYLNNKLPWESWYCDDSIKNAFSLSNSWTIKNVFSYESIPWEIEQNLDGLSEEEKNKILEENSFCPQAWTWEYVYSIDTRLNPKTEYKLESKNLEDLYWNTLNTPISLSFKTWELKNKDKYVYSNFTKFSNVFPKNLPIVLNFQTINSDSIFVRVCSMNDEGYKDYLKNIYNYDYKIKCSEDIVKEVKTKNNYWNLTNNKFDLEKDVLWKKLDYNYYLVDSYADKNNTTLNSATNLIIRTNLSLFLERWANKSVIYATDIQKHTEVKDLNFEFYDYNLERVNFKYSYNSSKKAYEVLEDMSSVSYILAKNKEHSWIITSEDYFSNYDYKYVSWMDSSVKNYLYVYTDRPIYRPKDEVFIKWILRDFNFDWFKKSKITSWNLRIIWKDYSLYRSVEVKLDKNSNFTTSFVIPEDSTLWDFRFEFEAPVWLNYYSYVFTNWDFSIEEYRKPSFKVELETDKTDFKLWEKTSIWVNPKYYFWWKMVNTDWVYSVLSQNYFFDAKEFSDYQFWISSDYFDCLYWWYCSYSDHLEDSKEFKISPDWNFTLDYEFPKTSSWEKLYTFSFDVTDPDTQKTVSNSVTKVLHLTDGYVWLKTWYYNTLKTWIDVDFVFLDHNAKPISNKKAKVELIKRNWNNVKKLWVDGVFYNEYSLEEKLESSINITWDKGGKASKILKTKSSWEYEIKVTYTWDDKNSFTSSNIVYVDSWEYVNWRNDNNTVTDLTAEKTTYKLWETANFVLKSPVNNWKAIIFVEKDDWIIDYFVHDIKSFSDIISLKIWEKHYPNVYLKAFLIWNQDWNPLPVYKRALSVVKVLTDYKNLNISIKTDKKNYSPWEKVEFEVEVLDSNWKVVPNANWSLSVVDESVLALKWNPRKNPYSFFYDMKRYLWVVSYLNLKNLVEKLEVKDTSLWEKWWSWEWVKWWDSKKARWNFKDTAIFISDFTTDKNWKARLTLDTLPDNLTIWVIEALVNTPDDNKIWVNYETIMTSKQVMIEDNLPRFLWSSDKITLSPVVYNRTWKDSTFKVSISSTLWKIDVKERTVFIKSWMSQNVLFDLEVPVSSKLTWNDLAKINISASNSDNTKTDSIYKFIQVKPLSTKEQISTFWKTNDISYDEKISIWNDVIKDDWTLTINYAWTLFSSLLSSVDYNNNFPYWCSEQRTSALMPNIYIKKLYDVAWVPFDLKTKMITKYIDSDTWYKEISLDDVIKDYLIEIKKFQNIDWWFSYWYDWNYVKSDVFLTSYILTSLSEIKSLWYKFDEIILTNGVSYLKKEFYDKKVCDENNYTDCLTLDTKIDIIKATLSVNKDDYESYKMYKILDLSKYENSLSKAILLSKLANIKDITKEEKEQLKKDAILIVNKILSNDLVFNPKWAFIMWNTWDRILNNAYILEIIWNLWSQNFKDIEYITDNIIRFLISSKNNSSFGSTFTNMSVIKSLTIYLSKTNELKNTNISTLFKLNNEKIDSKNISKNNIFEVYSKTISLNNLKGENIFSVEKEWTWSVYYDLNMSYYVPAKNAFSRDEWFYVDTKYYDYNEYKKIFSLKNEEYEKYLNWEIKYEDLVYTKNVVDYLKPVLFWDIWQLILVYNKVVTNEPRDQVFIESYIPSWSEIVNTNLATESKQVKNIGSNVYLDREELRDDKYFGWTNYLDTWIYNISYTIRLTHSWNFSVSPTRVWEFYTPEVFGRSNWFEFMVR